jgi:hypothetical protein
VLDTSVGAPDWADGCPYPGLKEYGEDRAAIFYGREQVIQRLAERLAGVLGGVSMLAILGASGVGKSSVLHAGLVPAAQRDQLAPGSAIWPRLLMTPGERPLQTLAERLEVCGGPDCRETLEALKQDGQSASQIALLVVGQEALPDGHIGGSPLAPRRLLVIVDQFEELFTQGVRESEQAAFLRALVSMATPVQQIPGTAPALVVICLRSDFFDRCADYEMLVEIMERPFLIGPMSETDLRSAIIGPANAAGLCIEPALLDLILSEVRSSSVPVGKEVHILPLLSHAMMRTWERREGIHLTVRSYDSAGGLAAGIDRSAEEAYERLMEPQKRTARAGLLRMIRIGDRGIPVRRRVPLEDLAGIGQSSEGSRQAFEALDEFGRAGLLTIGQDHAELAHEVIMGKWTRLAGWIDDVWALKPEYEKLDEEARIWNETRRDASFLFRGARLEGALGITQGNSIDVDPSDLVREFLQASVNHAHGRSRALKGTMAALAMLLITTALTAVFAFTQKNEALQQGALARHQEMIARQQATVAENNYIQLERARQGLVVSLDVRYVTVSLTVSPEQNMALLAQEVASDDALAGRRAGIVLIFAGGGVDANWEQLDEEVQNALISYEPAHQIFATATFENFVNIGAPPSSVELQVYLFNK